MALKNLYRLFLWLSGQKTKKRRFSRRIQKKQVSLDQKGTYHNLQKIYDQVNSEYFAGKVNLPFTWFGKKNRMPRSRFTFGTYNLHSNLVKIHRMLDQPSVPKYCIAFILYHEMLHHILPPCKDWRGRRKIHHAAFIKKEKEFREYKLAQAFLKQMTRGIKT